MVAYSERLGQVIRAERQRRGWTQGDVTARRGPSDTILSKMEAGEWESRSPAKTLAKLDDAFGWPEGTSLQVYIEGREPDVPAEAASSVESRLAMIERRLNEVLSSRYTLSPDERDEFDQWRQEQAAKRGASEGKAVRGDDVDTA